MPGKVKDITGQTFNWLTIESLAYIKNSYSYWNCLCKCGVIKVIRGDGIKSGAVKSCGCYNRTNPSRITHGLCKTKTPLYSVWNGMVQRCTNSNSPVYKWYGARGIRICSRWLIFKNFYYDMIAGYDKGLELDRIDNNGNYEPSNCRWVTRSANQKNTRSRATKQSDVDRVKYVKTFNKWMYTCTFKTQKEAELFGKYFNEYLESYCV